MKLTKGKIRKLYNKKRQSLKRLKKGKKSNKRRTFRRKPFNLANRTLKKYKKGGAETAAAEGEKILDIIEAKTEGLPVPSEPVASEPAASEPVASEAPVTSEPVASEPVASEPVASEVVKTAEQVTTSTEVPLKPEASELQKENAEELKEDMAKIAEGENPISEAPAEGTTTEGTTTEGTTASKPVTSEASVETAEQVTTSEEVPLNPEAAKLQKENAEELKEDIAQIEKGENPINKAPAEGTTASETPSSEAPPSEVSVETAEQVTTSEEFPLNPEAAELQEKNEEELKEDMDKIAEGENPIEEPVSEEQVSEEPVSEEPVSEEPVSEEPVSEEQPPAQTESGVASKMEGALNTIIDELASAVAKKIGSTPTEGLQSGFEPVKNAAEKLVSEGGKPRKKRYTRRSRKV